MMLFVNKKLIFFSILILFILGSLLYSEDDISFYNQGVDYFNNNDYLKAIHFFENAYQINPNSDMFVSALVSAYNSYALVLIDNGSLNKALSFLLNAKSLAPNKQIIKDNIAVVYSELGNSSFRNERYQEAINYYLNALMFNDDIIFYNNISVSYQNLALQEDDILNKILLLDKSIDYNNQNFNAYYNLGLLYFQKQSYENAISSFKKVYDNSLDFKSVASLYLGFIYENLFDFQSAKFYLNSALNIGINNLEQVEQAKETLLFIEDREYIYERKYYIINNSNYDLIDAKIKISFPEDVNNFQKVSLNNEFISFDAEKNVFKDDDDNFYYQYNIELIPANSTNEIILSYKINVFSNINDVQKLKFIPARNISDKSIFNYISNDYKSEFDLLKNIYNFVLDNISYKITDRDLSISEILKYNQGKCVEYTNLFNYLASLAGYKVRKVIGEVYEINPSDYLVQAGHTWSEIFIDDLGWYNFDPTFEDTGKKNYFGNIRTDRFITAYENSSSVEIDYKIKYFSNNKPSYVDVKIHSDKKILLNK
jgi:tetratricopeptide (TPR) repeat protein